METSPFSAANICFSTFLEPSLSFQIFFALSQVLPINPCSAFVDSRFCLNMLASLTLFSAFCLFIGSAEYNSWNPEVF